MRTFLIVGLIAPSNCFVARPIRPPADVRTSALSSSASALVSDDTEIESEAVVRSPMRFLGPYPTMPLRFPNLATSSQRERNVTGISLDWVLDTAANVNTINSQVAQELLLEKVGEAPGGVGAAGGIMGGDTFMLGDCQLDFGMEVGKIDLSDEEQSSEADVGFVFMKELTASALPVASPAAAGLLGLAFFYCFEGGVEFNWHNLNNNDDKQEPPSVTFHGSNQHLDLDGLERVPFVSLPVSMLPSVTVCINGKEIPALFDTGSPITVLNARAAEEAAIETVISLEEANPDIESKANGKDGWNPFSKLAANIRSAQEIAKAASRGDVLTLAGAAGNAVRLVKSKSSQNVSVKKGEAMDTESEEQYTQIGTSQIYVGDLPGLAALGGLGGEAPPAAVLGMDFLRMRPRLVFRAQQNEIYL